MWKWVLLCCVLVNLSEALKPRQKGVLSVKSTFKKARYPVVSYKCGNKKCTKKVRKYVIETRTRYVCAAEYKHDTKTDACIPQCLFGCIGGTCIAPNECHCEPPLYLEPKLNFTSLNKCVKSNCEPPCFNSICSNNTCICNADFTRHNSTHCIKCDPGFVADDFKCVPSCGTPCVNGVCTAPDVCTCDIGYTFSNGTCTPVCEGGCINSKCSAPDVCSCLAGFTPLNKSMCTPKCAEGCVNSNCIAPDTCSCLEGFTPLNNTVCTPKCDNRCVNSDCVAPNTCSCFKGYKKQNDTHCEPICENCVNGQCKVPGKCECDEGFAENNGTCGPVCNKLCVNGYCAAPNMCFCNVGYRNNASNPEICEECPCGDNGEVNEECKYERILVKYDPRTNLTCVGHSCDGRRVKSRYEPTGKFYQKCCAGWTSPRKGEPCKPDCRLGCENGRCVRPNECECDAPLVLKNKNRCVMPLCWPYCDDLCTAFENCKCRKGYIEKVDGSCEPLCSVGCVNGNCSAPDTCMCWENFVTHNKTHCSKACANPCIDGVCSDGVCICNEGFVLTSNNTCLRPNCWPYCDKCTSFEDCKCKSGYTEKVDGTCEPSCSLGCVNANCSAPDTCTCWDNFIKLNTTHCTKECSSLCINGTCIDGVCKCSKGYVLTKNNTCLRPNCWPYCNDCTAFEDCKCSSGYEENADGSCRPLCSRGCVNGKCSAPDICTCWENFTRHNGTHCNRTCDVSCINSCLDGVCMCDKGYILKDNVCVENKMEKIIIPAIPEDHTSFPRIIAEEHTSSTSLANMQITWIAAGAVTLLLMVLVTVVAVHLYRRTKKPPSEVGGHSVVFTRPDITDDDIETDFKDAVEYIPNSATSDGYTGFSTTVDVDGAIDELLDREDFKENFIRREKITEDKNNCIVEEEGEADVEIRDHRSKNRVFLHP